MKILHVNTSDVGGAATACRRIHLGLLSAGIDSKMLVLRKTKNIPECYQFKKTVIVKSFWQRIYNKGLCVVGLNKSNKTGSLKKHKDVEIFTSPISSYDITEHPLYKEADIIQLNWVSGFLDEPSFFKKNNKPVIWRMADLYACGGGNHYEKNFPFHEYTKELNENIKIRKDSLLDKSIVFVAISNWVLQKSNQSLIINNFPKKMIHNGVDFNIFKPLNKQFAREVFNLPLDKKILLIGADVISNKRKGFDLALEALKQFNSDDIQIVVFGNTIDLIDNKFIHIDEIYDEKLLAVLYSSADFFIMPSIEEAFGQVTIEALACGVPIVSFPNGGSLDIVRDEINGILAKDFTSYELSNAIQRALLISFNQNKIIKDVKDRFNIHEKAQEYIQLYKTII